METSETEQQRRPRPHRKEQSVDRVVVHLSPGAVGLAWGEMGDNKGARMYRTLLVPDTNKEGLHAYPLI